MSQLEGYVQQIRKAYPKLDLTSAQVFASGQNNDLVLVLDGVQRILFRFPRHLEAVWELRQEAALLAGLHGHLPIPIPRTRFVNLTAEAPGEVFIGYSMLPGEPLLYDSLAALPDAEQERVAVQLGGFLQALHAIPVTSLTDRSLPHVTGYETWADLYERVQQFLFPRMRAAARTEVAGRFEAFLSDSQSFDYELVLVHGDFGPSNILYDAATSRISGVIDFSGAGLGDPAVDLAAAAMSEPFGYGEPFLRRLVRAYPEMLTALERARFYASTFALQEALFGAEHDDSEALERGLAGLQ